MNELSHPSNPPWHGISSENGEQNKLEALAIYLLELQRICFVDDDRFSKANIDLNSRALSSYFILDTALDIVGFPSTGTVVQLNDYCGDSESTEEEPFCRGWAYDLFEEMVGRREEYQYYLEAVKNFNKWLPCSWDSKEEIWNHFYKWSDQK